MVTLGELAAQLQAIARVAGVGLDQVHRHVEARPQLEAGLAGPEADAGGEAADADVLGAAGQRGAADVGLAALLASAADPFVGAELEGVQRRRHEEAVAPAVADLAVDAGADLEPGGRHDHGVDERALDAVVDRRLVTLVEDADRHQQHAGAHVEAARQQEVDVGLFELQLAALLEALDERVLELELADEADLRRELVRHEQHEAVEVQPPVRALELVVVEVHVARQARLRLMVVAVFRVLGPGGGATERDGQGHPGRARPREELFLITQNSNSEPPKAQGCQPPGLRPASSRPQPGISPPSARPLPTSPGPKPALRQASTGPLSAKWTSLYCS